MVNPVQEDSYFVMLVYKNGALGRQRVRDEVRDACCRALPASLERAFFVIRSSSVNKGYVGMCGTPRLCVKCRERLSACRSAVDTRSCGGREASGGKTHDIFGPRPRPPTTSSSLAERVPVPLQMCGSSWEDFDELLRSTPAGNGGRLGLFIDMPEITPQINITGRFRRGPSGSTRRRIRSFGRETKGCAAAHVKSLPSFRRSSVLSETRSEWSDEGRLD